MTPEQALALRAPFPPEQIGKKPQPYKKDSPKGNCGECGQRHGLPAMHLSFVGHAHVTDRLLSVDPDWTWEPMATDPSTGGPLVVGGDLWIRMTVCGVTRVGVGDGQNSKERIGDAIRNAAMRFGVGLDLWAKESLTEGQHDAPGGDVSREKQQVRQLRLDIASLAQTHGWDLTVLGQEFVQTHGVESSSATPEMLVAFLTELRARVPRPDDDPGATPPDPEPTPADTPPPPSPPGVAGEPAPTGKTADEYRDELVAADTKPAVIGLMRGLELASLGEAQVADETGEVVALRTLAAARLKAAKP